MAIERPDFSTICNAQGQDLVPAATSDTPQSHQQLIAEMEAYPASVPATPTAPVPAKSRGFSGNPDWDQPRNAAGQFVTKSEGALREQWEREGGFEANVQRVLDAEQTILGMSENPAALQAHVA